MSEVRIAIEVLERHYDEIAEAQRMAHARRDERERQLRATEEVIAANEEQLRQLRAAIKALGGTL